MNRQILVNASPYETRVVILENSEIRQLHVEREEDRNVVGNIYKGVVKRVLPGMQAAFLELGLERTAFLYVSDIIAQPFLEDTDESEESDEVANVEGEAEWGDIEGSTEGERTTSPRSDEKHFAASEEEEPENERKKESPSHSDRPSGPPRRGNFMKAGRGRSGRHRGAGDRSDSRTMANIQDLLKEGQEILVQVAKAPIGTKGARLTTHISLPGRNVVLMPTIKHLGISRRIGSERERRRLRDIFVKRLRPKDMGFIVRTVAENKSFREIKADTDYLLKLWLTIQKDAKRKKAPSLIHEDLSLTLRTVRDFFTDEVDSFVIDDEATYEQVLGFIAQFMPRLRSRVKLFKGPSQLFEHYGIEGEITRALGRKVWLKSGGYLLIDQWEALTAIDVNTGRYVGSKSLEETILKTNLEAVKEIAYQLRVRNVGGIIIIDLIDMESSENREKVFQAFHDALGDDRSRTNILKISELGLVEMTRKRTHEDLVRYLTESCHYCDGRGYHKSKKTVCFEIFRTIQKEAQEDFNQIVVFAHPEVAGQMLYQEKRYLSMLEQKLSKKILIKVDSNFHIEQYEVFSKKD